MVTQDELNELPQEVRDAFKYLEWYIDHTINKHNVSTVEERLSELHHEAMLRFH